METKRYKSWLKDGRHYVYSQRTGKTYWVEPLIPNTTYNGDWGDYDPASKKVQGDYGRKHIGGILEKDSIITKENGFKNIRTVEGSPYWEIEN